MKGMFHWREKSGELETFGSWEHSSLSGGGVSGDKREGRITGEMKEEGGHQRCHNYGIVL